MAGRRAEGGAAMSVRVFLIVEDEKAGLSHCVACSGLATDGLIADGNLDETKLSRLLTLGSVAARMARWWNVLRHQQPQRAAPVDSFALLVISPDQVRHRVQP